MRDMICFHRPNETYGWLSNWYPSPFELGGVCFSSLEQCMMYGKAVCFGDQDAAEQILKADDPGQIKALGRGVSGYIDSQWSGIRQLVVYEGALAKFSQDPDLRRQLVTTGTAVLAECAVHDRVWGIGLSMTDPDRFDMKKWRGQNLLGYTLMMVRDKLTER